MTNIGSRTNDTSHFIVKGWSLKLLSTVVLGCMASSAGYTSDLEIYQGATYGNASIMMMLDNSGSMDSRSISEDYPNISLGSSVLVEPLTQSIYSDDGKQVINSVPYNVTFRNDGSGNKYYDRMSRLKMALIPMFANPKSATGFGEAIDLTKYKIGLGSFFYQSATEGGGQIDVPLADLTLANRRIMIDKVIGLTASTNTPIANAYATAGGYMLRANPQVIESETNYVEETYYEEVGYSLYRGSNNNKYDLYKCNKKSDVMTTTGDFKYYNCSTYDNPISSDFNNPSLFGGFDSTKTVTVRVTNNSNGRNDTKTTYYKKVVTTSGGGGGSVVGEVSQCDGYGIYFLTDGVPNNANSATKDLMETSLVGGSVSMGSSCDSGLIDTNSASGWQCIGEYSKALYNKNNAKGVPIATATVGFGNVFKQLTEQGKVTKTITRPSGAVETVRAYQCDAAGISQDAKNLCKLGEKGEGYGEGGFYYTEEPKDIANSVKNFIEDVSKAEIDPISAGTMSVPLDSLGGLKSRGFAYLPILKPVPGSPLLWNGNLKKYNVKNGTLVGSNGNFVFADNTGLFAKNTYDKWNTIDDVNRLDNLKPDTGLPQVGGAYQQVFENADTSLIGDRNLFVDTGDSLTNLQVTNNTPVNFATLTAANGYTNPQKLTLLNFMGYSEPTTTTVTDGSVLTSRQDKGLKNIGGVLHSIPQLITQKVEVDTSGQFDDRTRKDYVIYGSMDGALHMLDDSTGKETFTFIPKQILDLQPDAIAGKGTAKDGGYPYGVDAPWLTYVSYTTKSTIDTKDNLPTTTNTYEAAQSFALGGLRMGGSMYYALDVTKVNEPKMIYSVGSNYANRQKGDTTALGGTKNNTTNVADTERAAFANMGQTWGKPTLGYVKSGGKRVMVSFLPGGYDTCYENPAFKLNTSYPNNVQYNAQCNKAAAQGNAVYMVQMGEVKTDNNTEETVDTAINSGKLLWWASNKGSTTDSTSRSSSLQYSQSADLKHSVVTQIRALDRNYDGLIDHIYFADLGGQVWRVDINNNKDTENFKVDRVVKVLDVNDQAATGLTGDAPPRFYERPLITFHNGNYAYTAADTTVGSYSGVQAMITVGTGDRSNPVTATRSTPDALYSIIDKEVTRSDLFYYGTETAPTISLRTPVIKVNGTDDNNKLQELTFSNADIGTEGIKQNMQSNAVQGWYMPFTHWLGNDAGVDSKYKIKMFNEPDAIAGVLISSSFNPDEGQEIKACSAGVRGETQRERTCLPYGSCLDGSGNEIVTPRSFFNAGSGIVDNIISQYNDTSVFSSLVNRCEGDDCQPALICPGGNCGNDEPSIFDECVGPTCGVESGINTDKRINPLGWLEH